jgi:HTH-type transcriptional regulator, sugar sensing transcriptional regulator
VKESDLVETLSRFGLAEAETKALYQLGRLNEATATELAKATGLSRAEVYRAADALEARGLMERTIDRPQRFRPRPIQEILDKLIDAEQSRIEQLSEDRDVLLKHWTPKKGPAEADEERFQVQRGRTQIEGVLTRMLERAEREVAIAAPHRTVHRLLSWGIDEALEKAAARGVVIRLITQLTEDLMGGDGVPRAVRVRHSDIPTYAQFLIVDQKEIAVYVTADAVMGSTGRPETLLWLNAPDFVMGQQTLFDDLWLSALTPQARREELETGHRPHEMRLVRGRAARIDETRDLVSRARQEIIISIAKSDEHRLRDRLTAALHRAADRGVKVRILSPGRFNLEKKGIRVLPGQLDPRIGFVLIDSTEMLIAALPEEGEETEEWGLVTTVEPAVEMAQQAFEKAWGN